HKLRLERHLALTALWAARRDSGDGVLKRLTVLTHDLDADDAQYELVRAFGLTAGAALQPARPPEPQMFLPKPIPQAQRLGRLQALEAEIVHDPALEAELKQHQKIYAVLNRDLVRLRAALSKPVDEPPPTRRIPQRITYSLRVTTLGGEHLLRDGEPVSASEW